MLPHRTVPLETLFNETILRSLMTGELSGSVESNNGAADASGPPRFTVSELMTIVGAFWRDPVSIAPRGHPVMARRWACTPEIVEHEKGGLLAEPGPQAQKTR